MSTISGCHRWGGWGRGSSEVAWVRSSSLLPTVPGSLPLLKDAQQGGSALGWSVVPTPRLGRATSRGPPQLGCRSEEANPQTHIFLPTTCQSSPASEGPGGVLEKLRKEGWPSATSPVSLASCKVGFYAAFLNVKPEVGISPRGWC